MYDIYTHASIHIYVYVYVYVYISPTCQWFARTAMATPPPLLRGIYMYTRMYIYIFMYAYIYIFIYNQFGNGL